MLMVYIPVRQRMQPPAHSRRAISVPESSHSTAGGDPISAPCLQGHCVALLVLPQ